LRQPARLKKSMRSKTAVVLIVLALSASGCLGGSSSTAGKSLRITHAKLVREVGAAYGEKTLCSRRSRDGSRWTCLVGDGMDPECRLITVDGDGHWREQEMPPVCRFP
jgi:hypothetical protein